MSYLGQFELNRQSLALSSSITMALELWHLNCFSLILTDLNGGE